ncbi:Pentatricopeptide repeat-containing protein At4g13650 [Arabidopsis thaliana] [Rhizoctonia solani]|uniref:Pentatricopeptide repeat-containing protein At4g13650 [Arabidopsis thaliana] n=1 Tax=Rhizoctonia solani TaxID=456999 RepID=A0A0K6G4A2_9AGAM|nr:Pentatricopeptide repeat-containing protein At4g13650 [Arabidopsis thaliana] [Rhizoctonia solani]
MVLPIDSKGPILLAKKLVAIRGEPRKLRTIPIACLTAIPEYEATFAPNAEPIKQHLYRSPSLWLNPPVTHAGTLNKQLRFRINDRNIIGTVRLWLRSIENGVRPNQESYDALLQLFASYGLFDATLKGLNYVLESAAADPDLEAKAFKMFEEYGCSWDVITYQHILEAYSRRENLEMALQILNDMPAKGITPNAQCIQTVIQLAAQMGMPQLAMDLAVHSENIPGVVTDHIRMEILMSGAAVMNHDVVLRAWDTVRRTRCPPTEPLCVELLNTAARYGLIDLAQSVLTYLQETAQDIHEHHLAPIVGAYATAGQLREAYLALDLFKDHRVEILPESASALVETIDQSTATLDNAWDVLSRLPRPVLIQAVNATLQAAVNLSDMQRAIGIYKELSDLECSPTAETYDILLGGCLSISHAELGERLFQDMRSRGIQPTLQTYSRLILLSLTQANYEAAFNRVEEIKENKMVPPQRVYEALVRRCVDEGDPRAELALEDMGICGYRVSSGLRDYLLKSEKRRMRLWSGSSLYPTKQAIAIRNDFTGIAWQLTVPDMFDERANAFSTNLTRYRVCVYLTSASRFTLDGSLRDLLPHLIMPVRNKLHKRKHKKFPSGRKLPNPTSNPEWYYGQERVSPSIRRLIDGLIECIDIFGSGLAERSEPDVFNLKIELETWFKEFKQLCARRRPLQMTKAIQGFCWLIERELSYLRERHDRSELSPRIEAETSEDLLACYDRVQGYLQRIMLNVPARHVCTAGRRGRLGRLLPAPFVRSPPADSEIDEANLSPFGTGPCNLGTRVAVLNQIHLWADDPGSSSVYWINGMAGTGKTAIAYGLCIDLDHKHKLAASIFLHRWPLECKDSSLILPFVAYQLAKYSVPFRCALSGVLNAPYLDLYVCPPDQQFALLIYQPLVQVKDTLPGNIVVVIDALDECKDIDGATQLLEVLLTAGQESNIPIRFIISSRPEPQIRIPMREYNDEGHIAGGAP